LNQSTIEALKARIRDVPDFPKKGIVFRDITTLLQDRAGFQEAAEALVDLVGRRAADKVLAIESRGFIFGSLLADRLGIGFVPVRKPGKLPYRTLSASYELEYGQDSLEIHEDALRSGERVLVVDDVIATGGTARAVGELAARMGATVSAYAFLIELSFLNGRDKLKDAEVLSLIRY
jgi:adenine phosphoribosyltransferase